MSHVLSSEDNDFYIHLYLHLSIGSASFPVLDPFKTKAQKYVPDKEKIEENRQGKCLFPWTLPTGTANHVVWDMQRKGL